MTGLSSFADLRVVELGVWVAAPAAGAMLADWGADVIKVEPPTGDPMRAPHSPPKLSQLSWAWAANCDKFGMTAAAWHLGSTS